MNRFTLVPALLALAGGVAVAQPAPVPAPAPAPAPTADLDAEEPPAPVAAPVAPTPAPPPAAPATAPATYAVAAPAAVEAGPAAADLRPAGVTVGIGVGWQFPADLQAPNITSARFRLASGLTLEPAVTLTRYDSTIEQGDLPDETNSGSYLQLALLARKPVRERGKASLELVGGASLIMQGTDPEGPDNSSDATTFDLAYGLAVDYWLGSHLQLSVTGLNTVYRYSSQTQENGTAPDDERRSSVFGAVWNPTVNAMLHLYL